MRSPKGRLELMWMGKDMTLKAARLIHMERGTRSLRGRSGFDAHDNLAAETSVLASAWPAM